MIYFKDSEGLVYCFCESDLAHDENVKAKIQELEVQTDVDGVGYIEELKSTIRIDQSLVRISNSEAETLTAPANSEFELIEHEWVKSELAQVQIELMYHWTDDKRASRTLEDWKEYARDLRDYTSKANGIVTVTTNERPLVGK